MKDTQKTRLLWIMAGCIILLLISHFGLWFKIGRQDRINNDFVKYLVDDRMLEIKQTNLLSTIVEELIYLENKTMQPVGNK